MKLLRSFTFHTSAIVLGALWFSLLVTAWATGLGLLITLLGLPVIWLTLVVSRELAAFEAGLARALIGADVAAPERWAGWRLRARAGDPAIWRAQAYLLARFVIGLPLGTAVLGLWGAALGLAVAPVWYWSIPDGIDLGVLHVDTLGEAFAVIPVGLALGAVSVVATRFADAGWRALAEWLLPVGPLGDPFDRLPTTPPRLRTLLGIAVIVETVCLALWALSGRTSPWPAWTALGLFLPAALQGATMLAERHSSGRWRGLARQAAIFAVAWLACLLAWVIPGGGYFWPVWPLLGLATALALKALVTYGARSESRALTPRIEQLARTRAGAVDARDDELRRIERDLHDGAQARLVAVAMNLGLAEERLDRDPDGARELVAEAQEQARTAIRELRSLARGIAPPVLADRGLQAAVEALAATSVVPVQVEGAVGARPPVTVERAAYFVAAEALANAAKHAGAMRIRVILRRTSERLVVEVSDDGRGGARANGSGLSGLRQRVEAIDGRLDVEEAPGGGTIIRASLPCASS